MTQRTESHSELAPSRGLSAPISHVNEARTYCGPLPHEKRHCLFS
jgi:hypothetical protein